MDYPRIIMLQLLKKKNKKCLLVINVCMLYMMI